MALGRLSRDHGQPTSISVLDLDLLCWRLGTADLNEARQNLVVRLEETIARGEVARQACWTESLAVRSAGFLEKIKPLSLSRRDTEVVNGRWHLGITRGWTPLRRKNGPKNGLHALIWRPYLPHSFDTQPSVSATPDSQQTNNAITRGFKNLSLIDEPYWPMLGDTNRIEVLAAADLEGQARPLMWTFQKGESRVFASIIGHYTWTLDDPLSRILALRSVAWAAGEPAARLERLK
jgi:Trehalose utilisation